jgi:hypothetical protein
MPLHAITALHGEAGLRMRFAMETGSFPDAGRLWVGRALELAARLHAARAASAAAAAALMTLGLPIAASAWARSTIIPATLMTWAGGQAALASAWAMAAQRAAFSSSVDLGSVQAPVTAVNASASASASRSAMPRSSSTSVMMRPIVLMRGVCWRAGPDGKLDEIPPGQVPPGTW